jgi:hypothetical protein
MARLESFEDFARKLGSRWAYHIRPAVDSLTLPRYENMRLARTDGWDLINTADGSPWPWPDLDLPVGLVRQSQARAFRLLTNLLLRRRGQMPDRNTESPRIYKPPKKPTELNQQEFGLGIPNVMKD